MKKQTDEQIIRQLREEWEAKIAALKETVDIMFNTSVDGSEASVISPGLKLRNKVKKKRSKDKKIPTAKNDPQGSADESSENTKNSKGYLYTVVSVSPRGAVLKTPEGKEFSVDKDTLEVEYELD